MKVYISADMEGITGVADWEEVDHNKPAYAQFQKQMGPFMKNLESINWEILRSHVIGPVVLNERIDYFNAPSEGKSPSMRFHIVGHFFIEDGKIKIWKDWPMPGKEQFIG